MTLRISPIEALKELKSNANQKAWIDVRSEGEFKEGNIPGFVNTAILNDDERHQVGLTYKEQGQDPAVQLGYRLVTPYRAARESLWLKQIEESEQKMAVVTCWRGGLRSKLACEWIESRGEKTLQIQGGYKALRNELLKTLDQLPSFFVLSGLTGSGKTKLLKKLKTPKTDLEEHAKHRGSTFGRRLDQTQPSQASFENRFLLDIWNETRPISIEDESVRIGQVQVPQVLKDRMNTSPAVWIESSTETRIQSIYEEYVQEPLHLGDSRDVLLDRLEKSIIILRKKLGMELAQKLIRSLKEAFSKSEMKVDDHVFWIEKLLVDYYDKLYLHSFQREPRTIVFKGSIEECQTWIQNQYV